MINLTEKFWMNNTCFERYIATGALVLDIKDDKVYLDDADMGLIEEEYATLYFLAKEEGAYLPFEELYKRRWYRVYEPDIYDEAPDDFEPPLERQEALDRLLRIAEKINHEGKGTVYLNYNPNRGFCLYR